MSSALEYRRAREDDLGFVVGSWVDAYRTAHAAGLVQMADWEGVMVPQVEKVLARPGCEVWVACHPTDHDSRADLYGWIAVEHEVEIPQRVRERDERGRLIWVEKLAPAGCPLVHFVYVKHAYRRQGLAAGLFAAAGIALGERFLYTCKTGLSSQLERRLAPHAQWSPLVARYPKAAHDAQTPEGDLP